MNQIKEFINQYPAVFAIVLLVFSILLVWWLSQPIEIVYSPDAPPYPCSMGVCEDFRR